MAGIDHMGVGTAAKPGEAPPADRLRVYDAVFAA